MRGHAIGVHLTWVLVALCAGLTVGPGCGGDEAEPASVCGNAAVESGEACDDGNAVETDACLSTCVAASCGDGFVRGGVEECDGAPRACTTTCSTTGSQACASCAWEATCTPPAELCNGADDDCDGITDEDLAAAEVAFPGTPVWTGLAGASNLGEFYEDPCPAGEVAVGYSGELTADGHVGAIRAHCGNPSVACAGSTCTATVAGGTIRPLRGSGAGGGTFSALCPADRVIIGHSGWFDGGTVNVIHQLVLRCAPLEVTPPGVSWTIAAGAGADLPAVGTGTSGAPFGTVCAAGDVATVTIVRAGTGLHGFGLSCQTAVKSCP